MRHYKNSGLFSHKKPQVSTNAGTETAKRKVCIAQTNKAKQAEPSSDPAGYLVFIKALAASSSASSSGLRSGADSPVREA